MANLGLLILRLVTGLLLTGHGAQKLFGAFGGHGLEGTAGFMGSIGMRPGRFWAPLAGFSEFAGGTLTALGLFHPVGPIFMMGPMVMATGKVHWDKPIWVTEGGAELPVTNMAVATGLLVAGPGRFSLDRLFGIHVPFPIAALTALLTGVGIWAGLTGRMEETLVQVEEAVAPPSEDLAPSAAGMEAESSVH